MLKTNSKKAIENIKKYVIENTVTINYEDDPCYKQSVIMIDTGRDPETGKYVDVFSVCAHMIYSVFRDEYGYQINRCYRNDEQAAFIAWCQGLPGILDTCYYYNRSAICDLGNVLEETEQERSHFTENEAEAELTWLIYREIKKAVLH